MTRNRPHLILIMPLRKRGCVPREVAKDLFAEMREALLRAVGKPRLV
jgi:hypothetical protein